MYRLALCLLVIAVPAMARSQGVIKEWKSPGGWMVTLRPTANGKNTYCAMEKIERRETGSHTYRRIGLWDYHGNLSILATGIEGWGDVMVKIDGQGVVTVDPLRGQTTLQGYGYSWDDAVVPVPPASRDELLNAMKRGHHLEIVSTITSTKSPLLSIDIRGADAGVRGLLNCAGE